MARWWGDPRFRPVLARGEERRPPLRRLVLHRRHLHRDLLPAELSGAHAEGFEHALLRDRRRGAVGGLSGLQALPAQRVAGSPEWDLRADAVGRAMRLIADGVVDREGVAGLASQLGFSERHVHRMLTGVVGAGPLAIARAARAQNARVLLETTDLTSATSRSPRGSRACVSSTRRCRRSSRRRPASCGAPPRGGKRSPRGLELRLLARKPFDFSRLHAFLEHSRGRRRSSSPTTRPTRAACACRAAPVSSRCAPATTASGRASNSTTCATSPPRPNASADSAISTPTRSPSGTRCQSIRCSRASVAARPGMRVPGAVDGDELAMRGGARPADLGSRAPRPPRRG